MNILDSIPFPAAANERFERACQIAGALAELGVQRLTVTDPRVCASREIVARQSNLPRELANAGVGTTFSCERCSLLVDEDAVRWSAEPAAAVVLSKLSASGSPGPRRA